MIFFIFLRFRILTLAVMLATMVTTSLKRLWSFETPTPTKWKHIQTAISVSVTFGNRHNVNLH